MFYFYIVLSAALIPVLNRFFDILSQPYSWWLTPVLIIAFFLGFIILHLAVFAISILVINVNKPVGRGAGYFRFMVNISLPLILKLARVKIVASGLDKVPENKRMLVVCNHQHDFDPIIMLAAMPDAEIGFIGKKEIYKTMPFIGKAMHELYCLAIDRENNREAAKTILDAIKILKEDKASIGLFPEGYVSKSCDLLPLRNGSLKIAYKADVPIVVCVINNTRSIPKNIFRRKTEVVFRVLEIINPEDFKDLNTVELGDRIHDCMQKELTEIRNK